MPDALDLSSLKPASPRRARKRVGRGLKGQKSRACSNKMRAGFEGGQMPIYMRLGKQRGQYSKDAMPVGPHRTRTYSINVRDLERFDAGTEITPESLVEAGLIRNTKFDLKILGHGDLSKKLTVRAHNFSKSAREKIEQAGGSIDWLRGEPAPRKPKRRPRAEVPQAEPEPPETEEEQVESPEESEPEQPAEESEG